MILSSDVKPGAGEAPRKLRHILAAQVKPKVFDFNKSQYPRVEKRKPGGPMFSSQLGDIAAMKKRAAVAAIPDKVASAPAQVAEIVKKKGGRPKKAK